MSEPVLHPVDQYGDVGRFLDLRAMFEDACLLVDCIVAKPSTQPKKRNAAPLKKSIDTFEDALAYIQSTASPILPGERALRLYFTGLRGFTVHEEFIDHRFLPDLSGSAGSICVVSQSPWRQSLPDFDGGDDSNVKHFRILSMTTYFDVLGVLSTGKWVENKVDLLFGEHLL